MKRFLILIFAFIPFFVSATYVKTNLDFLFNGSIQASDSTLVDSLTGSGNASYKLTDVDFDITLGYIPGSSNAKLNGFPVNTWFGNLNYADTLFVQWLNQTLNIDSVRVLGYRIQRIAHYSTGTADTPGFFGATPKALSNFRDVGVGKTDATIDAAIIAATAGDSIYVHDGTYTENNATRKNLRINKNVIIKAVGNCILKASPTATEVVRAESTTDATIDGFMIDAESTFTYGMLIVSNLNVVNCYITGSALYEINAAADKAYIEKCVFKGDATAIILCHHYEVYQSTFQGSATTYLYSLNSSGTRVSKWNDFNVNEAISQIEWNRSDGTYISKFNNYNLNANITGNMIYWYFGGYDGDFDFSYNTFNLDFAENNALIFQNAGSDFIGNYSNNIFNYNTQGNGIGMLIQDADTINITGNEFYSTNTGGYNYIYYNTTTATVKDSLVISNNKFDVDNLTGYGIRVGEETSGVGDNTIEVVVEENLIQGNDGSVSNLFHSVLIGFQNNPILRYNRYDSTGYGSVLKSNTNIYTTENISYNVYSNCNFGFRLKGVNSVNLYNNTVNNCNVGVSISNNDGSGTGNNNVLVNNIISNCENLISIDAGGSVDSSNYNILYNGLLDGGTFAAWQGMGFDPNSFNTNPNFQSTTQVWPVSPSDAVGNGLNLGPPFNNGLDISSSWPDNVVLTPQVGSWTIGAYVISKPKIIKSQNKIIPYNGKIIKF